MRFTVHYTRVSSSIRTRGRSRTLIFFNVTFNDDDDGPQHISSNDLCNIVQQTIDNYDINSYIQIENWDPIRKCGFLYLKLYICALEENDVWGSPHNLIFVLLQFRLV